MRVAILGRTRSLYQTALEVVRRGHTLGLVGTCRAEEYYDFREEHFAALAKEHDVPFFCDRRINRPDIVAKLVAARCEVALSVNWLTIIGAAALDAFPFGILNAHAGDLPRYRGNACPNWAILNGEPHVGLCVHKMLADLLDQGPILARAFFALDPARDIGDVYVWLGQVVPKLMADAVDILATGRRDFPDSRDDPRPSLRCYPRRPEDSRIDWSESVERIHRLVRASTRPFAGAFAYLDDERCVRVWKAAPATMDEEWIAVPGQILGAVEGDPLVACGDGALRLCEITVDGCETPAEAARLVLKSLRNRLH